MTQRVDLAGMPGDTGANKGVRGEGNRLKLTVTVHMEGVCGFSSRYNANPIANARECGRPALRVSSAGTIHVPRIGRAAHAVVRAAHMIRWSLRLRLRVGWVGSRC